MTQRYVHLTPRTEAALELLSGSRRVADIGCDHGRLTAALLQRADCEFVVASDLSEESLRKARQLIGYIGLQDRVSFRAGDGLSVLREGECDALAILGMGGTLMARILSASPVPLMGAKTAVLQPMRAQADLREYLYRAHYRVTEERIVQEGARLYELMRVEPGTELQRLPHGWPHDFFEMGFVAWERNDPLFSKLLLHRIALVQTRLSAAKGSAGEAPLLQKLAALESIRDLRRDAEL
ncbi:MAG: SAM-dependent methyltransferase [Clostridia bacterium]|nr:SAM-dependent methyltransferase [Clostridia bacterium]